MSASIAGSRDLPASKYDLSTYLGRVRQSAEISDPRTLFTSAAQLEHYKSLLGEYKNGKIKEMNEELWLAKKTVDATLHPDTGEAVFLPFRMSAFVPMNLIVTAGMLTPGMGITGTLLWQITNQSLNVGINASNANKSSPITTATLAKSYALAVTASCSVALGLNAIVPRLKRLSPAVRATMSRLIPWAAVSSAGALNVFLMRGEEMRKGIDVYPLLSDEERAKLEEKGEKVKSLGKSQKAATIAVSETAFSRVFNSTPVMALPPLILAQLQKGEWLKQRPRMVLPVNLGLISVVSVFALPFALGAFPQNESVQASSLEEEFHGKGGKDGLVVFNRGI